MEAVLNGRMKPVVAKSKSAVVSKVKKHGSDLRKVEKWGTRYVVTACVLSSGLNAWANVDMCASESVVGMVSAAILGAVVPVLVWMLGKIAGHAYKAGKKPLAGAVGAAGVGLLFLSIWHCGHAIALLTGSNFFLAGLLAVGIDYGLVASEVASVIASDSHE